MRYDPDQLPLKTLLQPLARASEALACFDERLAQDVLQTRRRIVAQEPDGALSPKGLLSLRQALPVASPGSGILADSESTAVSDAAIDWQDLPSINLDAIDAVLARSADVLAKAKQPQRLMKPETDPRS